MLVVSAMIVVPALVYGGYLELAWDADPAGIKAWLTWVVVSIGACIGGLGAAALYVGTRKR